MKTFAHNFRATNVCLPPVGGLEHPHLLCDRSDIEALRGRIRSGRPRAIWNRLVANCDLYRDPNSEHFVDVEGREGDFGKTRQGYYVTVRSAAEMAFVGLVTGDEDLGRRGAEIIATLLSPDVRDDTYLAGSVGSFWARPAPKPPGFAKNKDQNDGLGIAYDLAEPFLTREERDMILEFLLDRLEVCWSTRWTKPAGNNNRPAGGNIWPAQLALALWGDSDNPVLAEYPAYAEPNAEDYLDDMFYSDGSSLEGVGYGKCLAYAMDFAHTLSRKGIQHGLLAPRPFFKNLALFYYLTREPGDHGFAIAKLVTSIDSVMTAEPMWLQIARFFDVPLARWWWRRRFDALCENPDLGPFRFKDRKPYDILNLLFCDDADEDASPEELGLPSSYHFKKRGLVIARRDHGEDTPVFRLTAGRMAAQGTVHQHWDAMSMSLTGYGQQLIVDPGYYYVGVKGTPGSDLLTRTAGHSSILIDGEGQETLSEIKAWPAAIVWHEREEELEYVMAAGAIREGITCDGYGPCTTAERHALVVHEGPTPFYVVTCDIFDYPEEMAAREPALQFVLIAAQGTELSHDESGATIIGPKARLRAELMTREGTTAQQDALRAADMRTGDKVSEHNERLIWSRKGRHGRMMTVLTPLKDGMEPPRVELCADDAEKTACVVRFGECEDRITFWALRRNLPDPQPMVLKSGMRMKIVRTAPGKPERVFTIPTLPGPYTIE